MAAEEEDDVLCPDGARFAFGTWECAVTVAATVQNIPAAAFDGAVASARC